MSKLETQTRLTHHDDLYERLIALYDGLDEAESMKASAKLILLLANHVGDESVIEEAIADVKTSMSRRAGRAPRSRTTKDAREGRR